MFILFNLGTNFEYLDDLYLGVQTKNSIESLEVGSTASANQKKQAGDYFDSFVNFNFNYDNAPGNSNSFVESIQLEFNNEIMISQDVADYLYLLYAQPMYYHTRVPKRKIFSYSFALRPEDPEPTGQVNMSRIINKLLKVTMNGEYGPGSDNRNIRIYAKNYNVLRIQDGLAGLIFIDNTFM